MGGELTAALDDLVDGRDVILLTPVARGVGSWVDAVRSHGGGRVLVVAAGEGAGDVVDGVDTIVLGLTAGGMSEEVLALEALTDHIGPAHHAAIDAWDPQRRAVVLANPVTVADEVGGRPVIGARRAAWAAVEDKATVDALLAAADVPVPPSEVVDPSEAVAAARRIDTGHGVVLAVGGRNGGAEGVRWVAPADAGATALELVDAFVGARGDGVGRVRVARFVEGVPCSIGAAVTADGVGVVRPIENVVLRRGRSFVYSGLASTYDPPEAVRSAMAAAARRVGEELRRRVGYRGCFSVDGIVGADGWVATEVNARQSGGFNALPVDGRVPHVGLLQMAVAAGDERVTAAAVEATYGGAGDAVRTLRVARVVPALPPAGPDRLAVVVSGATARPAAEGEEPHGQVLIGEAASGAVVLARLTTDEAPLAVGPPAAPLAASLLALAADHWGTPTAGLTAARPFG